MITPELSRAVGVGLNEMLAVEDEMEQPWYVRLLWWLCEKANHPLIDGVWIFNGHYHRQCRICRRIVSEPINP